MNRTYLVVPMVSMAAFAAYYLYWRTQPASPRPAAARVVDAYVGRDGRKEAEDQLAAGKLILIETGIGMSWDAERREIAAAKYGLELRRVTEPPSEAQARYIDAFNRTMRPKVTVRHGRGFFDTLHQEAIALHESRKGQKTAPPAP